MAKKAITDSKSDHYEFKKIIKFGFDDDEKGEKIPRFKVLWLDNTKTWETIGNLSMCIAKLRQFVNSLSRNRWINYKIVLPKTVEEFDSQLYNHTVAERMENKKTVYEIIAKPKTMDQPIEKSDPFKVERGNKEKKPTEKRVVKQYSRAKKSTGKNSRTKNKKICLEDDNDPMTIVELKEVKTTTIVRAKLNDATSCLKDFLVYPKKPKEENPEDSGIEDNKFEIETNKEDSGGVETGKS